MLWIAFLALASIVVGTCSTALLAAFNGGHRTRLLDGLDEERALRVATLLERIQEIKLTLQIAKVASVCVLVLSSLGWSERQLGTDGRDLGTQLLGGGFAFLLALVLVEGFGPRLEPKLSQKFLLRILPWLHGTARFLAPLNLPLLTLQRALVRAANVPPDAERKRDIAEEILGVVSETDRQDRLAPEERDMIEHVVRLHELEVSEVMTPRTDILALEVGLTLEEAIRFTEEVGHSRLPVYEDGIDKIIGIFFIKDILPILRQHPADYGAQTLRDHLRKPFFVPETKRVHELLQEFRREKQHMAVILDEYGGTAGLITIEDILEEIVGDIVDEYDEDEEMERFEILPDGTIDLDAKLPVEDVNEQFGIDLPEGDDFDTVGGFVFSSLGKVPRVGERFTHDGIDFEILEADDRRIHRLKIKIPTIGKPSA